MVTIYSLIGSLTAHADCNIENITSPDQCNMHYEQLSFEIQATTGSSINQLRVQPAGLELDNRELSAEIDGTAYGAQIADLDGNGWPEIYVFITSAGSGGYGSLIAYGVNNGKSVSPIYLPPMDDTPEALEGYMGHDKFSVLNNCLIRRFPVYTQTDTNAAPSGGTRQLQYRLIPGEAGWLLQMDCIVEN
ncbi:MAG: PliI family lysozyme inhibitor of I-type lysozyme [Halioglobus sp.]